MMASRRSEEGAVSATLFSTMTRSLYLFGLFSVLGCASQKAEVGDGEVENVDTPSWTLVFSADAERATAGDDLGFQIWWENAEGEQAAVETFTLSSSIESELVYDADSTVVTAAGVHELTVSAEDTSGEAQSATSSVEVDPGPVVDVSLSLSADVVLAGEPLMATITATDAYANSANADDAALTVSEGVTVDGMAFMATATGEYTATVTLNDATDDGQWSVTAGAPAAIDLVVEESAVEVGDATDFEVTVTDEYGNPVEAELSWTLEPGAVLLDDEIEFEAEGVYVCTVTVADTDVTDSETVTVDSSGPVLVVEEPERADWTDASDITVVGTVSDAVSGVRSLTVNGEVVEPGDDGSFTHDMALNFGLNIVETTADDNDVDESGDSNQTTDVRSVLYSSDWFSPDWYREEALLVRINEGPGGLDQLGAIAPEIMDSVDLESMLGGELYSTSGGWWIFSYDISMSATSVSYGDVGLTIDAVGDGTLDMRMTVSDLVMTFVVEGYAPLVSLPADGLVRIGAMHVDLTVRPTIEDGAMSFDDFTVSVPDPEGLEVEIGSGLTDMAGAIGLDIDTLIIEEMRSAVEGAVGGASDGLLDGALGDFGVDETFEISGMSYTLQAELGTLEVDDLGMTLGMETRVVPEEVLSAGAIEGPEYLPVFDWWSPDLSLTESGLSMALSTDVLNQMMFAMWQGGLLDQSLNAADLGVDPALLGLLLPGIDDATIVTTPGLPPVFTPREDWADGNQYDFSIGGMAVDIYDGDSADGTRVMSLYVAMRLPVALGATGEEITMTLGEATVYTDMTYADPAMGLSAAAIEPLFGPVLAGFVPELTGELSSIPLPSLDGFTLSIDTTTMLGGDEPPGFWVAQGTLE